MMLRPTVGGRLLGSLLRAAPLVMTSFAATFEHSNAHALRLARGCFARYYPRRSCEALLVEHGGDGAKNPVGTELRNHDQIWNGQECASAAFAGRLPLFHQRRCICRRHERALVSLTRRELDGHVDVVIINSDAVGANDDLYPPDANIGAREVEQPVPVGSPKTVRVHRDSLRRIPPARVGPKGAQSEATAEPWQR